MLSKVELLTLLESSPGIVLFKSTEQVLKDQAIQKLSIWSVARAKVLPFY